MLICRKQNRLLGGFEVRYNPKQVVPVSVIRVEPIANPSTRGGRFTHGFKLIVKGQGDFLAFAKTEELKSQWIDAINHARYLSCLCIPRHYADVHLFFLLSSFREMCAPREGRRGEYFPVSCNRARTFPSLTLVYIVTCRYNEQL